MLAAELAPDTPVAMVESASMPDQRVFRTRVDLLPLAAKTALGDGPALLLIGQAIGAVGGCRQGSSLRPIAVFKPGKAAS